MTVMTNQQKDVPAGTGPELPEEFLDALIDQYRRGEVELTGSGGFLSSLIKAVLERGLQAELADHLGYDKHDRAGHGSGNSRNGYSSKTLSSEVGPIEVDTPRDRAGSFTPSPAGDMVIGLEIFRNAHFGKHGCDRRIIGIEFGSRRPGRRRGGQVPRRHRSGAERLGRRPGRAIAAGLPFSIGGDHPG